MVLHSRQDDASALQVRLARKLGGFAIGLLGCFRESYASYQQITERVLETFRARFGDPGVMFEQNIDRTVHLEVQVLRDRYGNARHFGMRDCTEQRASQKIQEEAPPAILRNDQALAERVQGIAVAIADRVGYVGAGTVELMYARGEVYFLEMNTRVQVEHPVTGASHGVRRGDAIEPLNLVQWQLRIANGAPIDFAQEVVVCTHVARELRINAEAWRPDLKDPRDGGRGLFVPNGGVFDRMELPDPEEVTRALAERGVEDVRIRFDVGFEVGDTLINKDPTFGKLIVAVKARGDEADYERLRLAILEVLERTHIEGRQVRPDGRVVRGSRFETNLEAHRWVLEHAMMKRHAAGETEDRHVGWVVDALRAE